MIRDWRSLLPLAVFLGAIGLASAPASAQRVAPAQEPVRVSLPPLLARLGLRLAQPRTTSVLQLKQRVAVVVVDPSRLAGALPAARASDRASLELMIDQGKLMAEVALEAAAPGGAGAAPADATGRPKSARIVVGSAPSQGLPQDSI